MEKRQSFPTIDPHDPRVAEITKVHPDYRDAVGQLTAEECDRYRGKVLAVLIATGAIIADADSPEELQEAVRASKFSGQDWRLVDGPTDETPMTLEELIEINK